MSEVSQLSLFARLLAAGYAPRDAAAAVRDGRATGCKVENCGVPLGAPRDRDGFCDVCADAVARDGRMS